MVLLINIFAYESIRIHTLAYTNTNLKHGVLFERIFKGVILLRHVMQNKVKLMKHKQYICTMRKLCLKKPKT